MLEMGDCENEYNGSPVAAVGPEIRSPLKSPARTPKLKTPGASAAKLAPNHTIFMANIDSSPSRRKEDRNNGGGSSSTRVIENLHDQIDTLTSTNLQLTLQSNNLLSRLEAAQQREAKLLETTASLRHENENVASMLNRKSRKLKDLEDDFVKLDEKYNSLLKDKADLEDRVRDTSEKESKLKQEIEMVKAQYDALVDSQDYYRKHYTSELDTLRGQLDLLKQEQRRRLEQSKAEEALLDTKLSEFETKCENWKGLDDARLSHLESKCNDIVSQLDLPAWINLYKESKNMLLKCGQEMNIKIPEDLERTMQDPSMTSLELTSQQRNVSPGLSLKMAKVRSGRSTTSPNVNTFSNAPHAKRSSFYGGAKQIPQSVTGSLPGLKRSSSRRKNSGRAEQINSSAEASPVLRQASRNASSPSPRMVSQATFRKS
ncbi:hypothetical protein HG536_0B01920 [Torulaspora globosa]|uniref:SWI5-dependent HO expression protein 3 n=1 Tax=Torulaspora globosa TaxID=48254 RepID=A0A7G3ZCU3_9SACH|nr:uncharacterized protein HG536_0B01920 [Torulaspora globosa]QLL31329.1 hypothetical protein HG536_0B01920 [Torulaspora globosa]